jgi:hypothetical protein
VSDSKFNESESPVGTGSDDGYVTLYRHDFDVQDSYWYWDLEGDTVSGTIRDGYAFLNMTDETTSNASGRVIGWDNHPTKGRDPVEGEGQWLYASMEVRLRCSDNNQLEGEEGGGLRAWGLVNYQAFPRQCILFLSLSPGSIPEIVGFWAETKVDNRVVSRQSLKGIDMTEWHVYTALWEEGNSTLLVDGEVVGTVKESPSVPMFGDVFLQNLYEGGDHSWYLDVVGNVSIQVDYVRLFATKERFSAWSEEVSRAEELLDEAVGKGIDTADLADYMNQVRDVWREGYYNHCLAKPYLEMIIPYLEHFDEVSEMFSSCAALIEESRQKGLADRTIKMMEGHYAQAEVYWGEYNYEDTELNLRKIVTLADESS